MDFVAARLLDGRWFRVLTVVDQFTRECLLFLAEIAMGTALALQEGTGWTLCSNPESRRLYRPKRHTPTGDYISAAIAASAPPGDYPAQSCQETKEQQV